MILNESDIAPGSFFQSKKVFRWRVLDPKRIRVDANGRWVFATVVFMDGTETVVQLRKRKISSAKNPIVILEDDPIFLEDDLFDLLPKPQTKLDSLLKGYLNNETKGH